MERESNQMQTQCRSGCGFYGSPATDGLCSLCYKEALKKKQQLPTTPSSHCNALSMASAASPTTNHINPLVSHADFSQAETIDQSQAVASTTPETVLSVSAEASSSTVPGASAESTEDDKEGDKDKKNKKNRCRVCRKKVGLTGFECRCGGLFCAIHRYSDKHQCDFDYRELGAKEIRRNNPVVVGEKIQKI